MADAADASGSLDAATASLGAGSDGPAESIDLSISDEPPYAPGSRRRPRGAMAASNDDDLMAKWNRGGPEVGVSAKGKPPHPAPRVKVDLIQVRGHIDEANVLRLARAKGYWPFRLCYEDGLRRAPKLHGMVRFQVTVGPGGAARTVRKIAVELDDSLVTSCILKTARGLALAVPEQGSPDVTLEVTLWPGDAPLRTLNASAPARAGSSVPEELVTSLRDRWPQVRACYAEGLRRRPGLWGRLALRLRVTAAGQITEACEVESHFPDQDVSECALRVYERAGLAPSNEERVIVYPLRLGNPAPEH